MKSFLAKIYAYKFFDDLILIYPLYAVMFSSYKMDPWQISILLLVWSTTAFILEIPSGVLADKYSRKNILFIGQMLRAVGFSFWLFIPNFLGFLIGFIFWGIKSALTSGTFQALIYDELKSQNQQNLFANVLGKTKSLSFLAILIASLLSSPAIVFGYNFVLIISVFASLVSAFFILSIPKVKKITSTKEKEYFNLLKLGIKNALGEKLVFKLIIFLSLAFALGGALDEFWTLFASKSGLPNYGLGIFMAVISGAQAIASYVSYKFEKRSLNFFYILFFINGLLLFISGYLFSIVGLAFLIVFSFLFTILQTVIEAKVHHSINSGTRATVASVQGFFIEIGAILVYLGIGFFAQKYNYSVSFMTFGLLISALGIIYIILNLMRRFKLKPIREPKLWEMFLALFLVLLLFFLIPLSFNFLKTSVSNFKNNSSIVNQSEDVKQKYLSEYTEILENPKLTMYGVYKNSLKDPLFLTKNLYEVENLTGTVKNYFYFFNPADANLNFYNSQSGELLNSINIPLTQGDVPREISVSEIFNGIFLLSANSGGSGIGNFADIFIYKSENNKLERIKFDPRGVSRDSNRSEAFSVVDYGEDKNELYIKTSRGSGCNYEVSFFNYHLDSQSYNLIENFFVGCSRRSSQKNFIGTSSPYLFYSNVSLVPGEDYTWIVDSVAKVNYKTGKKETIFTNSSNLNLSGKSGSVGGNFIKISFNKNENGITNNKYLIINLETNQFEEITEAPKAENITQDSVPYEGYEFNSLEASYKGAFRLVKLEDYKYDQTFSVYKDGIYNSAYGTLFFDAGETKENLVNLPKEYIASIINGSLSQNGDILFFVFKLEKGYQFGGIAKTVEPELTYESRIDLKTNTLTMKLVKVEE